jgi:hypothetical protein
LTAIFQNLPPRFRRRQAVVPKVIGHGTIPEVDRGHGPFVLKVLPESYLALSKAELRQGVSSPFEIRARNGDGDEFIEKIKLKTR